MIVRRLALVDWDFVDYSNTDDQVQLVRELLANLAEYAVKLDAVELWPFFDISALSGPPSARGDLTSSEVEQLGRVPGLLSRQLVEYAIRFDRVSAESAPDSHAANPYEPLIRLFEVGGRVHSEHGFVDVAVGGFRLGKIEGYLEGRDRE